MRPLLKYLKMGLLTLPGIAVVPAMAQTNMYQIAGQDPKTFSGAFVVGANFTQVDGDSYSGYHKVGLHMGGMVYVHFSERVGASMELLYTQKGSRAVTNAYSTAVGPYLESYSMNLNYVEVPIAFHLIVNDFDGEAGLSAAYLIKSSEFVESDQPVIIDPLANRFNSSDIDWLVGVTHQVYRNLFFNARYQYSITSIRPSDRIPFGYSYGNSGQYNNLFTLRFEYFF